MRAGTEECDDGGLVSLDGCNSTCKIESNYICVGGTPTSQDTCTACLKNYAPNSSKNECLSILEPYSQDEAIFFSVTLYTLVVLNLIIHMMYSIYVSSGAQSTSNGLGQTQLIMLLPEMGAYLPLLIRKTVYNLREVLLSFYFLQLDSTPVYDVLKGAFGYASNTSSRNYSLIQDGSSIMNMVNFLGGIVLCSLFFIIIYGIKTITNPEEHQEKWWGKLIKRLGEFALSFGFINWFVKYTYLFIIIISFPEIQEWNASGNIPSQLFAVILLIYTMVVLVFSCVVPFLNKESPTLDNLFLGLKHHKWQKFHIALFFIRRFLFGFLVFFLIDQGKYFKIIMFSVIQGGYITSIGSMRSYVNLKDKLTEIVNEIIYYILIVILFVYNERYEWTKFVKYVYLTLLLSNIFITFVIGISKSALLKELYFIFSQLYGFEYPRKWTHFSYSSS